MKRRNHDGMNRSRHESVTATQIFCRQGGGPGFRLHHASGPARPCSALFDSDPTPSWVALDLDRPLVQLAHLASRTSLPAWLDEASGLIPGSTTACEGWPILISRPLRGPNLVSPLAIPWGLRPFSQSPWYGGDLRRIMVAIKYGPPLDLDRQLAQLAHLASRRSLPAWLEEASGLIPGSTTA